MNELKAAPGIDTNVARDSGYGWYAHGVTHHDCVVFTSLLLLVPCYGP